MTTYNGHRSWNAWNVSLWLTNDEWLYRTAVECLENAYTFQAATDCFFTQTGLQGTRTPDGAHWNHLSVRRALRGLEVNLKEMK
jgi:hypothetical protein